MVIPHLPKGRPEFSSGGGGDWGEVLGPKNQNSQISVSFCKISFFSAMKSGFEGGVLHPPPPPQETLSC